MAENGPKLLFRREINCCWQCGVGEERQGWVGRATGAHLDPARLRGMLEYVLWDMSEPGVEDADLHSRL